MGKKTKIGISNHSCRRITALILSIMLFPTMYVSAEPSQDNMSLNVSSSISVNENPKTDTAASGDKTDSYEGGIITWDQLEELVRTQNPTYQIYVNSSNSSLDILSSSKQRFDGAMQEQIGEVEESLDRIKEQKAEIKDLPGDTVIDRKGTTAEELRQALDMATKSLKSTKNSINLGMGQFQSVLKKTENSIEEELQPVREQLTKTVEELYIMYNQLRLEKESISAQENGYRKILEQQNKAVKEKRLSDENITELKLTVNALECGRIELETAMEKIRSVLLLQLGENPDSQMVIGVLPENDYSYIEQADPERDFSALLKNSKKIEDLKDLENYTGTAAIRIRDITAEEAEAEACIQLFSLYYDMRTASEKRDAAATGAKASELEYKKALELNSYGQFSDINTDILKIQYESKSIDKQVAETELFSAINAYQWALRGQVD